MFNFQVIHPIHDQSMFLSESQKKQLKEEFGKILVWIEKLTYLLRYVEKSIYVIVHMHRYRAMDI